MKILHKTSGAGDPERNWADVKYAFNKQKAHMDTGEMEKKMRIYSTYRRGPSTIKILSLIHI